MRLQKIVPISLLALAAVPAIAVAATNTYVARSFTQPASAGRPVDKPLDEFKVVAGARVVVRTDWKTSAAKPGQLRFTSGNNICHYTTTYRTRTRIADDGSAEDYVTGALPSPGRGYLLDSGTHGSAAFRVVRQKTTNGIVHIDALWSRVLTSARTSSRRARPCGATSS